MRERFDELQRQAQTAFAEGELQRAAELFSDAEGWALEHGEQDLADRSFCNRCAVLIELQQGQAQIPRLKQILMRSSDPMTCYLAAYYSAEALRLDDDWERALSYARRARELAATLEDPATRAAGANLLGTLDLRACLFDEAEEAFAEALCYYRGSDGYHRIMTAQVKDNLGYVKLCRGNVRDGLELCEEARSELETLGADRYLHETLQDLCYGYVLDDRLEAAERCGERALELASQSGDELVAKNCLFLLSEIAVRRGDTFRARRYLRELVAHYPAVGVSEEIIEVFLATDLTTVVNLRG